MKRLSLFALVFVMACGDAIAPTHPDPGSRTEPHPDLVTSYGPGIGVVPEIYEFGDVALGQCASCNIEVSNDWWGNLSLVSIVLTDGSDLAFTLVNVPAPGTIVAPGSSLWFDVVFCPTLVGPVAGTIEIQWTNGEAGTSVVELVGTGTAATTAAEYVEWLISQTETLVSDGTLNEGQGNSLISKLENALTSLTKGNIGAAINQLEAFINQVEALINSGRLTPEEGQPLIDAANAVLALLE